MYPKGHNKTPKALILKCFRGCYIYSSSITTTVSSVFSLAISQYVVLFLFIFSVFYHFLKLFVGVLLAKTTLPD